MAGSWPDRLTLRYLPNRSQTPTVKLTSGGVVMDSLGLLLVLIKHIIYVAIALYAGCLVEGSIDNFIAASTDQAPSIPPSSSNCSVPPPRPIPPIVSLSSSLFASSALTYK